MTEAKQQEIRENVARIRADMSAYPKTKLMAVIKTRTTEEINFAIRECGITLVGENRVQELLEHYEGMDRSAELHFIGTLQKNKVKYIIDKVDMIESLDSEGLAEEIEKRAAKIERRIPVLIEINIGREESKGGIMPEALVKERGLVQVSDTGAIEKVMSPYPIVEKMQAFGLEVVEIDGHDFEQMEAAFAKARETKGVPFGIVMKTVKGKHVSFMENNADWHGKAPNDAEFEIAMNELKARLAELEAM